MSTSKLLPVVLSLALLPAGAIGAEAGQRRGVPSGGRTAVGRAVPRTSVAPRIVGSRVIRTYRPYYYPYYGYGYPGLSFSLYGGYPDGYAYPYAYGGFGYYGYPYAAAGYAAAAPGAGYGGVRIQGAPRDAQVFADGYYVGIADDFDGALQRLSLAPGTHRIEIRTPGNPPMSVDVRIEPGQTITYHADRTQ